MADDSHEFSEDVDVRPEPSSGAREEGTEFLEPLIRKLRMTAQAYSLGKGEAGKF